MPMATSQTIDLIAQPRFSEYPLSGTAAAKRLWTSDGWDVYLPEGKKTEASDHVLDSSPP